MLGNSIYKILARKRGIFVTDRITEIHRYCYGKERYGCVTYVLQALFFVDAIELVLCFLKAVSFQILLFLNIGVLLEGI